MLELLTIILSLGAVNALIPILVIMVLLVAAAGLNRGYSLFNLFGITTLAGINPAGKASIAGKSAFSVLLAGGFPGTGSTGSRLGIGKRIKTRLANRSAEKKKMTLLKDAVNTAAGHEKTTIGGRIHDRNSASVRGPGAGRLATSYKKFVISKPPMGARKRAGYAIKKLGNKYERSTQDLGRKGGTAAKTAGAAARAPARATRGTMNAVKKVKTAWSKKGKAAKIAVTAVGLAGLTMVSPILPAAYAITKGFHYAKSKSVSQKQVSAVTGKPTKMAEVLPRVKLFVAAVAPLPYMAYSTSQLIHQRGRNWENARSTVSKFSADDQNTLNGIIQKHLSSSGHSDINAMSSGERRAMDKELRGHLRSIDESSYVNSGQRSRLVPTALAIGVANLGRAAAEGMSTASGGPGGVRSAGRAVWERMRTNAQNMGAVSESTNPARMARAAINIFKMARVKDLNAPLDSIGLNTSAGSKTARDMLQFAKEKTISNTTDKVLLEAHSRQLEDEMHLLEKEIAVVTARAAGDPHAARVQTEQLEKTKSLLAKVGNNTNTDKPTLTSLAALIQPENVREAVAANRSTELTTLRAMESRETSPEIRSALARNATSDTGMLDRLSKDLSPEVKAAVASNPNTDAPTLRTLQADPNPKVAEAARLTLKRNSII